MDRCAVANKLAGCQNGVEGTPGSMHPHLYSFALIDSRALLPHEEVDRERLGRLVEEIGRDGVLRVPVMVDRHSLVILDGHHRVLALGSLGCDLVPVYLVDYEHPSISVTWWKTGDPMQKSSVIDAGQSGHRYPPKMSRHLWAIAPQEHPTRLRALRLATMSPT